METTPASMTDNYEDDLSVVISNPDDSTVTGSGTLLIEEASETTEKETDTDIIGEETDYSEYGDSLIGIRREKECEMFDIYCAHARIVGFSVRRSTGILSKDGNKTVVSKLYVCSCNGLKDKSKDVPNKKRRGDTRTNCKAQMRIKLVDGLYEVVKHILDHNHCLTRQEWNHLHRSERAIRDGKALTIVDMVSSGIKPADSFRYLALNAGGEEQVGHTMRDHLNFVNRQRMKAIEGGDTKTFMELIQNQNSEETDFFYRVQMDDEGRLTNAFWRDSMMKEDYGIYGDVMVFDTTYRTNRYNLICAPFVGINNHRRNTMFGCAFLSNEKIETFEWLFTLFKKSMGGRSPVTIFTDQDAAIANAIEKVFPETRHRLCIWHLQQNAISRFAKLKCDEDFKEEFNKCLSWCTDEDEFERRWNKLISGKNLQNHEWFTRLYNIREKWCTALNKDFFSAGMLSSQRSESANSSISFNSKKTTSLTEFFGLFYNIVETWRIKEKEDEFQSSRAKPDSSLTINGLVKHASQIYTYNIYKIFEVEFMKCISSSSIIVGADSTTVVYEVTRRGVTQKVIYDFSMNCITCSCKRFEERGILCSHSLRVLHINSVDTIPDSYIKKRWTKNAKSAIWDKTKDKTETWKVDRSVLWRHDMARNSYNMILESEGDGDARKILEEGQKRDSMALEELKSKKSAVATADSGEKRKVLDPKRTITKGRKKRTKNHFGRRKKKTTVELANEFGSMTPNPHLF